MKILCNASSAKIFCMAITIDQCTFMMYHTNSYANNPVMMRSTKPMIMRDIFLTSNKSMFPNPLSSIYCLKWYDASISSLMMWLVGFPIVTTVGWKHALPLYFLGGTFSGFANLFQSQLRRDASGFDYNCTSHGAIAAVVSLSFLTPSAVVPLTAKVPCYAVAAIFLAYLGVKEYVVPKMWPREKGSIQVNNWGFVGGVFCTFIYASLFMRSRKDLAMMKTFYGNISKSVKAP